MNAQRLSLILFFAILFTISIQSIFADDSAPNCSNKAGTLPRPNEPIGLPDRSPIDHIVVVMNENHSFDNVLGQLSDPKYYGLEVDGLINGISNPDHRGDTIVPFHQERLCVKDMDHNWDGSHYNWNNGKNDNFVRHAQDKGSDATRVMGYYNDQDYPLMYFLADKYATSDRYFSSVLGPTHPNRFYLYAGTSFGTVKNYTLKPLSGGWKNKTIFDALNEAGVSWTFYHADLSVVMYFTKMYLHNLKHFKPASKFDKDAKNNLLPQVVFFETSSIMGDEHPPFNFQLNQHGLSNHLQSLIDSPSWLTTAAFITYDEGGGSFDHVPPPMACEPDAIQPILDKKNTTKAKFDRYGFRVPFLAISPWVKKHFVSHQTYDHTSVLKLIETKFNVPALSARDANADPFSDLFDFENPDFSRPTLPSTKIDWGRALGCLLPTKSTHL